MCDAAGDVPGGGAMRLGLKGVGMMRWVGLVALLGMAQASPVAAANCNGNLCKKDVQECKFETTSCALHSHDNLALTITQNSKETGFGFAWTENTKDGQGKVIEVRKVHWHFLKNFAPGEERTLEKAATQFASVTKWRDDKFKSTKGIPPTADGQCSIVGREIDDPNANGGSGLDQKWIDDHNRDNAHQPDYSLSPLTQKLKFVGNVVVLGNGAVALTELWHLAGSAQMVPFRQIEQTPLVVSPGIYQFLKAKKGDHKGFEQIGFQMARMFGQPGWGRVIYQLLPFKDDTAKVDHSGNCGSLFNKN